jgi:hypothetical protein
MKKTITITQIILVTVFMQSCKLFEKVFKKGKEPVVIEQKDSLSTMQPLVVEEDTVLKKVIVFYGNDFDYIAKQTTLDLLKQDKNMLNKAKYQSDTIANKINDLEKYHKAKLPLTLKYNEAEITKAISSLQTINRNSPEVENLITLLENYVYARKHLIDIVQQLNIMRISRIQKEIENEIYKNDGVNAETYPYLYDICSKILKMNRDEIDKNYSNLLEEI